MISIVERRPFKCIGHVQKLKGITRCGRTGAEPPVIW